MNMLIMKQQCEINSIYRVTYCNFCIKTNQLEPKIFVLKGCLLIQKCFLLIANVTNLNGFFIDDSNTRKFFAVEGRSQAKNDLDGFTVRGNRGVRGVRGGNRGVRGVRGVRGRNSGGSGRRKRRRTGRGGQGSGANSSGWFVHRATKTSFHLIFFFFSFFFLDYLVSFNFVVLY
jgi:hypothetical protein